MDVKSMTGFSRASGDSPPYRWTWELKAVNAKGLDVRLRSPTGFDSLEPDVRAHIAKRLSRGACYANLALQRADAAPQVRINHELIETILAEFGRYQGRAGVGPVSLDGVMNVRGVVDLVEASELESGRHEAAFLAGLDEALEALVAMRRHEGRALAEILQARLVRIKELVAAAHAAPGRKPEAVRARLARLIDELAQNSGRLDPVRLHQEALLIAAKADVTEEIDRLRTHVTAAQALLESHQPIGRRLDFLAQELARESNTLCAKSNDAALTTIGIEVRVEIEQFREQVQNIE